MTVDFGKTAGDYGRHRAGFPDELFDRLEAFGVGRAGQSLLDLGTGTGSLARGFAARGARVTAIDRAPALLEEARRLSAAAGLEIDYRQATAEASGLADGSFQVVTAGQCWHWFDRPAAAREARRLLQPGGRLVICHFDWLPRPGNLVARTEALIQAHNPAWTLGGGDGLYPAWFADAQDAGFTGLESFTFDQLVAYGHEAWRGRIRASAGVAASLPPEPVAAFDQALAALLAEHFPDQPLQVPHRLFALLATAPR
jgi:SAM-dependent methyltransferase